MSVKPQEQQKRIQARFYSTDSGNEPVKEALSELGRPIKTGINKERLKIDQRKEEISYEYP